MLETVIVYMQKISSGLQYKESAFVMITCEDYDTKIADALRSIPEVKEIQYTCGNYDIIVKIETESAESLKIVLDMKIRKIEKIRATTVLISSPVIVFSR